MDKDYKSFSGIAKVRFKSHASDLGYKQVTGTLYVQEKGNWYNCIGLQKSSGNDFFYVNYGIGLTPEGSDNVLDESALSQYGLLLHRRLSNSGRGGFDCSTKMDVKSSAEEVGRQYRLQAVPWLESFQNVESIVDGVFEESGLSVDKLGIHSYFQSMTISRYAHLLKRIGKRRDAMIWLREAERILLLPVYYLRDGSVSHAKEKYARLKKKEEYEVELLEKVKRSICELENA